MNDVKPTEKMDQVLQARCDQRTKDRVRNMAKRLKCSESKLVAQALGDYLDRNGVKK